MTTLSPDQELEFRLWYAKQANKLGLNLNPDDPRHMYDYRGAFKSGVEPTYQPEHKQFRWPDRWKVKGYPDGPTKNTWKKMIGE